MQAKGDDCAQAPLDENSTFISDESSEPIDSVDAIARYRKAFQFLRAYDCESREKLSIPRFELHYPERSLKLLLFRSLKDDKSSLRGAHHRAAEQKKLTRNRLLVLAFCHDDAIADAAVKFGTVHPSWARHLRRPYQCSGERETLQIALIVDMRILKHRTALPTFVSALAHHNKSPLSIFILTVGLTSANSAWFATFLADHCIKNLKSTQFRLTKQ